MTRNWFSNMMPLDEPFVYGGKMEKREKARSLLRKLPGIEFRTVENFYQAMKAPKSDWSTRKRIASMNPYEAKRYWKGQQPRRDWKQISLDVMEYALRIKFAKGTSWHRKLMATDGEIVEWNNWHDKFWGRCVCRRCKKEGDNHLGKLLMKIRDEVSFS